MVHRYTHVVEEMYDRRKTGPLDQTFSRLSLIPSFRTGGRRLFALVADDRARSRKKDDCFFFFLSSVNVDHCEFLRVFSLQNRYIYIFHPRNGKKPYSSSARFLDSVRRWSKTGSVKLSPDVKKKKYGTEEIAKFISLVAIYIYFLFFFLLSK